MQFPIITTRDLNGDEKTLPADFTGDINLIFIAYYQWHQREVDSWIRTANQLEKEFENFQYYELPVVGEMNWFGQKQLDFWMRTGIQDRKTRARTLTLYVNQSEFRQQVGIDTENTIALILLNREGKLLWQALGPYSDETAQSLFNMVRNETTALNNKLAQ